jgi:hypothetical protein
MHDHRVVETNQKTNQTAPFTEAEITDLHSADKFMATAIIAIMVTIFTAGLIGYIAVAWIASGGPS